MSKTNRETGAGPVRVALAALLLAAAGCGGAEGADRGAAAAALTPTSHDVAVGADGAFDPVIVTLKSGDSVTWHLAARTDAVARRGWPTTVADLCTRDEPYRPADPNELTGPMPRGASGVFALGPVKGGLVEQRTPCPTGKTAARAAGRHLCATGSGDATLPSTWRSPHATGVFIRLAWRDIDAGPAVSPRYRWAALDREVRRATEAGKLYSIAVKAGATATPDWIFDTDRDGTPRARGGGVARLIFRDAASHATGCGPRMDLGSPTDATYQKHYFDMLKALAAHLKRDTARYRALAYVKLSGANLFTHENRLPKRCAAAGTACARGCCCNPQVWARAGYTPSGLYAFYERQAKVLADAFPEKTLSYMLIQDGFPRVNDKGDYERVDGSSSGGPLPRGTQQTEEIIRRLQRLHGPRLLVQHNGLGPLPDPAVRLCAYPDRHPIGGPPYARAGTGCPNRWVLRAGYDGRTRGYGTLTAFQTNNAKKVGGPAALELTFLNSWFYTDAIFLEIYEERLWEAEVGSGGVLDPSLSGLTLGQWAEVLHERRRRAWSSAALPDPFPATHRHTFRYTLPAGSGPQVIPYVNPRTCGHAGGPAFGVVVVNP